MPRMLPNEMRKSIGGTGGAPSTVTVLREWLETISVDNLLGR